MYNCWKVEVFKIDTLGSIYHLYTFVIHFPLEPNLLCLPYCYSLCYFGPSKYLEYFLPIGYGPFLTSHCCRRPEELQSHQDKCLLCDVLMLYACNSVPAEPCSRFLDRGFPFTAPCSRSFRAACLFFHTCVIAAVSPGLSLLALLG